MSLVSFSYFTCVRTLLHSFPIIFFLNFILFLPYALFPPGISLIAQLISLLHFQTIFFLSRFSSSAHFPHDMMSIVVITSSSNRQDQTLSPSIPLSLASLPFASILKPEMPMTHLFIPSIHTRASSCSHCIYRIHCVGYLPTRLLHTLFHIIVTSYLATGF